MNEEDELLRLFNKESGQAFRSLEAAINNTTDEWRTRTLTRDVWRMLKAQERTPPHHPD